MLTIDRLEKSFDGATRVLGGITLSIAPGESSPSWAARAAASPRCCASSRGSRRRAAGAVRLDGEAILAPHERIGVVFQEPRLFPWLTVAQNVGFRAGAIVVRDEVQAKVERAC